MSKLPTHEYLRKRRRQQDTMVTAYYVLMSAMMLFALGIALYHARVLGIA